MVRLGRLPEKHIIDGFKGVIDFYVHKGIPCARRWPRYRKRTPTPPEAQAQQAFAYINKQAPHLPVFIKRQFQRMAAGTPFSWKDLLVRAYITGIRY